MTHEVAMGIIGVYGMTGKSLGKDGIVVAEAVGKKQGRAARVRISNGKTGLGDSQ